MPKGQAEESTLVAPYEEKHCVLVAQRDTREQSLVRNLIIRVS